MPKFNVYLYKAVRIRLEDIEADTQEQAARIADEQLDMRDSLCRSAFEDEEVEALGALVDVQGDEEFDESRYFELGGAKLYLLNPS